MNSPEADIQFIPGLIMHGGGVTNDSTRQLRRGPVEQLHGFITRVYMVLPRSVLPRSA